MEDKRVAMNVIPRNTETVLLAVWKLKDGAYGLAIIDQVEKDTGLKWLPGTIYGTLARLKKNGWVQTTKIEQPPNQVGRPRIYYKLTSAGMKKLIAAQEAVRGVWGGIPNLEKSR